MNNPPEGTRPDCKRRRILPLLQNVTRKTIQEYTGLPFHANVSFGSGTERQWTLFFTEMLRQTERQTWFEAMKWRREVIAMRRRSQTHLGLLYKTLVCTGSGCAQKLSSSVTGDAAASAPLGEPHCILSIGDVITRHYLGGDYLASQSFHSSVACTKTHAFIGVDVFLPHA